MIDLPPPPPAIEIVIANEGTDKGIQETDGIQVRGALDFTSGPVTVGTALKTVDTDGEVEASTYVGATTDVAGFTVGGKVSYKATMGHGRIADDNEAVEIEGSLARSFGPMTATVAHTYSPNDIGLTGRSHYTAGTVALDTGMGFTLSGGAGRRDREFMPDYTAYNAGVSMALTNNVNLDVRYSDTNRSNLGEEYAGRTTVSVGFRF
jgi:uncharacterized protein (TIGR02001 family)